MVFNKYYFNIQKAVFNAENKTMLIAFDSRHIAILNSEGKEIASKQLMARVIDVINLGNNKTFIEFETGDTRTINASLQGLDNGKIEQNDQLALIGNDIVTIKDSILKFWNADQFLFKPDNLTRFGILIDTINNFNIINAGKYYTYITIKTGNDTLKFEKEYSNEISAGDVSITFKTDSAAIGASSAIIYLSKNDINITEIDRVKFKIEEFYTESSNRYFLIAGKTRNEFFYLYPLPAFIRSAVKTAQTNPATKN